MEPYLSVVVTARNDDHGGNLLGRMQAFMSGWIAQARRHNLPSELIIVEWNPPAGRAPLQEVLRWPAEFGPCQVRFIVVPPELHGRYKHAEALPLYQMIAKNAGIHRARGRFILATNIDILFSNELMAFLAEQRLQPGRMYRIDRHDAMSDVPPEGGIDEQLEYCRTHLLRINVREGTFPLTPDGRRALAQEDIAAADSGITLGRGWFPVECYSDAELFRWVDNEAEMDITMPPEAASVLDLDLEPGPGAGQRVLTLQITLEETGSVIVVQIDRRSDLRIRFAPGGARQKKIRLRVLGGGETVANDARILNFRVFSCKWGEPTAKSPGGAVSVCVKPISFRKRALFTWEQLQTLIDKIAKGGPLVTVTLPVSRPLHSAAAFYVESRGFTGMARQSFIWLSRRLGLRRKAGTGSRLEPGSDSSPDLPKSRPQVVFLHTNACGDFTLAAREHWLDLRGYPEFDMFSMNTDSVFCYAAHHGGAVEEVLPDPMRIYHIEHGSGSGWTPEGQAQLFARIQAKGLTFVSHQDVVGWAAQMRRLNSPMIFNHENWGLADFDLEESQPRPGTRSDDPGSLAESFRSHSGISL